MRLPAEFQNDRLAFAMRALNIEGEFTPNAAPAERLARLPNGSPMRFPDGRFVVEPDLPFWMRLRDVDYKESDVRALAGWAKKKPGKPPVARPQLPGENVYRKAQETFRQTLRDLVEPWLANDRDFARCFREHPDIEQRINAFLTSHPASLQVDSRGDLLVGWPVTKFPRGRVNPIERAREEAFVLFIELMQHPARDRVGKCARCGRFFLGRAGQKCCSRPRRCGSELAAIRATKESLQKVRNELLRRAQQAVREWEQGSKREPWKESVAKAVGKTGKWVTHAVNTRELAEPKARAGNKTKP
jgi:hypothetical protein